MLQTRPVRVGYSMPIRPSAPVAPAGSAVPYDFATRFELRGEPGRLVQDIVSVGPDGDFTAVAISYAFEEDRRRPVGLRPLGNDPRPAVEVGAIRLDDIPADALVAGVRVNPAYERLVFRGADDTGSAPRDRLQLLTSRIPEALIAPAIRGGDRVLQRLKDPEPISFLFSLIDTTTGRELQDQPVHNIAALGNTQGDRPFRFLARPFTFSASSTIRVQIVERTPGVLGTLFIVLIGYKVLRSCKPVPRPAPGSRRVPFDYVARLDLEGVPGRRVETEIPICIDGGFTATSVGYGLEVPEIGVPLPLVRDGDNRPTMAQLSAVRLDELLPPTALVDGFRIKPTSIRFAFQNDGHLAPQVPVEIASNIFERLNQPETASFRYRFFDDGRGIELQNIFINNVAGLGTASGDRPFKQLAAPLRFLPRSTFRVTVEEILGRGRLYIVLQGYRHVPDARRR
jgi:hypothetical protein